MSTIYWKLFNGADLTDHLYEVDDTGNLKVTCETEENGRIPFIDTLIVCKPDKSIKLLIYRKPTHTDQYLNFKSAQPLHHKLGVVRTLLDRKERVVTEPEDKIIEEKHIKTALTDLATLSGLLIRSNS